jgi:hypothetical protein
MVRTVPALKRGHIRGVIGLTDMFCNPHFQHRTAKERLAHRLKIRWRLLWTAGPASLEAWHAAHIRAHAPGQ